MNHAKPYEELYIYLLNGTLAASDEDELGSGFIGNWVEGNNAFLFFHSPAEEKLDRFLQNKPELHIEDRFRFPYEEWQGGGLDPLKIGPFLVIPPWLESPPDEGFIKILLDPGVVFGNCLHPTTHTCLEALSLAADRSPLGRVLDLGTGTGILAIAATLLGAEKTLAVDFNPLCVKTAEQNFALNGLAKRATAVQGKAEDFAKERADLILANIQFEVIREFLNRSIPDGPRRLIISGQMRSQWRDLKMQLESAGYHTLKEWDHDMTWFTVLAEKP